MSPSLFDPMRTLLELQSSLDDSSLGRWLSGTTSGVGGFPPVNVFERGDGYVAMAELPGLDRESLTVEVHRNRLRIAGRRAIDQPEGASVHRCERRAGSFDRTIALPVAIDRDRVEAGYRDGMLVVELPRSEAERPRTIEVSQEARER